MNKARFHLANVMRRRPQPLAAIFPPTCWATGQSIAPSDNGLCPEIQRQIRQQLLWPYCQCCGSTLGPFAARGSCRNCPHRKLGLDRIIRVGTLNGPLSRLIHSMKFAHTGPWRAFWRRGWPRPYTMRRSGPLTNWFRCRCIGSGSGGAALIRPLNWAGNYPEFSINPVMICCAANMPPALKPPCKALRPDVITCAAHLSFPSR